MVLEFGLGFLDRLAGVNHNAFSHLEDLADRLNHFISCAIILMLSGVTMANVYFLRPIACTLPTAPENKFNEFAESVCWVRGTIAIRNNDQMPITDEDWEKLRERADMSFYQWVPFCLSIQGMLFFIPHILWQIITTHVIGENLECILDMAYKANTADDYIKRFKYIESAAYQLFRLSRQHYNHNQCITTKSSKLKHQLLIKKFIHCSSQCFLIGKHIGNYISLYYLLIKLLYLINLIGQLYIIKIFLGNSNNLLQFSKILLHNIITKHEWIESEYFPRQTYCPVNIRQLGSKNNIFTAICALPINMFNEKIYIFLWLWIAFVTIVTIISLLIWLLRLTIYKQQNQYIRHYLIISIQSQLYDKYYNHQLNCLACNIHVNDIRIEKFIMEFVKNDGFFLLRMIRSNAGDVITGEILNQWWHMFIDYYNAKLNSDKQLQQLNEKNYDFIDQSNNNSIILHPNSSKTNGNFV
ncbi:hypothetical protein MN116_002509 [Schistosoma mekongi]|uniref:Innexin n=1 Tax=Schistosoma mekongi TaxID=38744 RepID=A0AAE1ZKE1_SCHME|nr:hypothetical protein MN116_002509 [Schistosoma mekongi]